MGSVNEAVEPLPIVGPLCDEHRAKLMAGDEDWELQGSEQSADGSTDPYILMGDSLRALNQYVLLAPPTSMTSGTRRGDLFPLRVHRRGDSDESELTLLITREMLPGVAQFFQHVAERFGKEVSPE